MIEIDYEVFFQLPFMLRALMHFRRRIMTLSIYLEVKTNNYISNLVLEFPGPESEGGNND